MIPHDVAHSILCLCEEANSPRALSIAICLRYEEWDTLLTFRCSPAHYHSSGSFFRDNLVTEILRKCKGIGDAKDLRSAAVLAFHQSEHECYRTNERLTPYLFGLSSPETNGRVWDILSLARKYVRYVLGPVPTLLDGRFGPGATFADRGKLSTVPDKMSGSPTLTRSAARFIPDWAPTSWGRAVSLSGGVLEETRGNRFTTVPKDSTKDRGICVEPSLNVYYQLALGREIRRRLMRIGIDLNNGQSAHRSKACKASVDGILSTIDLSNASDTLSSTLVKLLMPEDWFNELNALRSPFTRLDGSWVRLEKFSSMGNGYTFELETLVFLALSFATLALAGHLPQEGSDLLVYGDDILVPSVGAADVLGCLRFFGFTPNAKKTFVDGSFRESCGGDFFDGRPVRAFYLKEFPNEPHKWIAYANGLRGVVSDHHRLRDDGSLHFRTWHVILHNIPSRIRDLRGPRVLGDAVVHDHPSRFTPFSRDRTAGGRFKVLGSYDPRLGDGIRYWRSWGPINHRYVCWDHFQPPVVLACALYGVGDGRLGIAPRDNVLGFGERWVAY